MNEPDPNRVKKLESNMQRAHAQTQQALRDYERDHPSAASSADEATSSPPSPETAKSDASPETPQEGVNLVAWTDGRVENHIVGHKPFILLEIDIESTSTHVIVGGLLPDPERALIANMLMGGATVLAALAREVAPEVPDGD